MRREANAIFKSFTFGPIIHEIIPKDDFDTVMGKFDGYFIHERKKFNQRSQLPGESKRSLHDLAGPHDLHGHCDRRHS
ncbi:hypothetical protein LSAT2_026245, partial [Lamellibrachia satsuma]